MITKSKNCFMISHSAVSGKPAEKSPIDAYRVKVGPYAQYDRTASISWLGPRRRTRWMRTTVTPTDIHFITIEQDGAIVYDSRTDVPCDMEKWNATYDRFAAEKRAYEARYLALHGKPPSFVNSG